MINSDIGYDIAGGAFNWVDGHYVKPYKFSKDSLGKDETFTIGFSNFQKALSAVSELEMYVLSGDFVFVENHVCIKNSKYCCKNSTGTFELTDYARHHIDECCIKFKCKTHNNALSHDDLMTFCYLCRDVSKLLTFELDLVRNQNICRSDNLKELNDEFHERVNKIRKDIYFLKLSDILKYLMHYFDMDIEELAETANLSEKTIMRYINGENKVPDKNTLIQFIVAFELPPTLSTILLDKAGIRLIQDDPRDEVLLTILKSMYDYSIDDIDGFLIGIDQEPLSKEK